MAAATHRQEERVEPRILGRLVVYLRMRMGASQQDLAKVIGTSKSQLSKWERGRANLQVRSREKIAAAFELTRQDFEELAQRLERTVSRFLARLHTNTTIVGPTGRIDAETLRARLAEVHLRRRDLEAERADIEGALRAVDRDENFLLSELKRLTDDGQSESRPSSE